MSTHDISKCEKSSNSHLHNPVKETESVA